MNLHQHLTVFSKNHSCSPAFVLATEQNRPCTRKKREAKAEPQMFTSSPVAEGVLTANPPSRTQSVFSI